MKRRNVLKKLFGGIVVATAFSTVPALASDSFIETDDDKLDRLVAAGDFIQAQTFILKRTHHYSKPAYINRCTFISPNMSYVYAAKGSVITNNIFDHSGLRYNCN